MGGKCYAAMTNFDFCRKHNCSNKMSSKTHVTFCYFIAMSFRRNTEYFVDFGVYMSCTSHVYFPAKCRVAFSGKYKFWSKNLDILSKMSTCYFLRFSRFNNFFTENTMIMKIGEIFLSKLITMIKGAAFMTSIVS